MLQNNSETDWCNLQQVTIFEIGITRATRTLVNFLNSSHMSDVDMSFAMRGPFQFLAHLCLCTVGSYASFFVRLSVA